MILLTPSKEIEKNDMATRRIQKNLTVMFTDISGFTKHTETISRDDLMKRLETHNELLMPVIAHFEGRIVKTIGDAFLITFESPTNAVQCGLFMQHTLAKWNVDKDASTQIHIKVSINSGEVTVTETDVFGDPVNVAAKIEKATNPDEIYFTESVFLAMVKAEVPTSFVKTFRPKGAESQEIKLYRVAQDEGDERYKKIIASTHIDVDKVKTRVMELSTVAEREFNRYQDTLEELVKQQGKSSRGVISAVIAAALILAVAIII
ncbi:MAG: adenylate/guanylate cyclase domain-containing protein, partial [Planctomycetota bacterium]